MGGGWIPSRGGLQGHFKGLGARAGGRGCCLKGAFKEGLEGGLEGFEGGFKGFKGLKGGLREAKRGGLRKA